MANPTRVNSAIAQSGAISFNISCLPDKPEHTDQQRVIG